MCAVFSSELDTTPFSGEVYWSDAYDGSRIGDQYMPLPSAREKAAVNLLFSGLVPAIMRGEISGEPVPENHRFEPMHYSAGTLIRYDVERLTNQPTSAQLPKEFVTQEIVDSLLKEPYGGFSPDGPFIPYLEHKEQEIPSVSRKARRQVYDRVSWFSLIALMDGKQRLLSLPLVDPTGQATKRSAKHPINGQFLSHLPAHIGATIESTSAGGNVTHWERVLGIEVFERAESTWQEALTLHRSWIARHLGNVSRS